MKKTILTCILALFATVWVFAQQQLPVVAVAPFDAISGLTAAEANMISRAFHIRLGNTHRVILVDREIVDRVMREHSFQAGDWSNQQKTAALGDALNANWIVRGNFERFGSNILFTVSFYDIATFQFRGGDEVRVANADAAYEHIQPMVENLMRVIEASGVRPSAGTRPATNQTYNIGDRGPAGGIVFYDKGVVSNGWRYLEAAPHDLGPVRWGAHEQNVSGTEMGVGSGKRNTEIIVARLRQLGETGRAAQVCASYDANGFTDWFLPSRDELNLMFQNLKRINLGNFSNHWYWSSSQVNSHSAWGQGFDNGSQGYYSKSYEGSVRAVRAF